MPRRDESPTNEPRESRVDALAESVALQILRGELVPGARLPSVRELALRWEVNVSTVQRVLAKLEEQGLVATRPRSGVEVRDTIRQGGAALLPLVLRHGREDRDRAIAILRDGLETRRVLALHVASKLLAVPVASYLAAMRTTLARFERLVDDAPDDLVALANAENEILRIALVAAGKPTVLAVFNDLATLLLANDTVRTAMYADSALHVAGWRAFIDALASADGSLENFGYLEPLLASMDERVVAAFAASLDDKAAFAASLDDKAAFAASLDEKKPARRRSR